MKLNTGCMLLLFAVVALWVKNGFTVEPTPGVVGWRQAQWGMTETEVLAAFKGEAKTLKEVSHFGGKKDVPDSWTGYTSIGIDSVSISTGTFKVSFSFDRTSKGLTDVTLSNRNNMSERTQPDRQADRLCENLEKMLTEKYGAPTYSKTEDDLEQRAPGLPSSFSKDISWKLQKTLIGLHYLYLRGTTISLMTVTYHNADVAKDGEDKL